MQYLTMTGHLSAPCRYYQVTCDNVKTKKAFNLQLEDYLSLADKKNEIIIP